MESKFRRRVSTILTLAMIISLFTPHTSIFAASGPKLSSKKANIVIGKTKTIRVKCRVPGSISVKSLNPSFCDVVKVKNKLKKIKDDKKPKYSIFYDEIKDFEKADEFVKAAKAANAEMFNEEILKEIYYNSGICSKKMHWFRKGAIASFVTIALSLLAALFYFLYAIGF